jgi:hypothetical protein
MQMIEKRKNEWGRLQRFFSENILSRNLLLTGASYKLLNKQLSFSSERILLSRSSSSKADLSLALCDSFSLNFLLDSFVGCRQGDQMSL